MAHGPKLQIVFTEQKMNSYAKRGFRFWSLWQSQRQSVEVKILFLQFMFEQSGVAGLAGTLTK